MKAKQTLNSLTHTYFLVFCFGCKWLFTEKQVRVFIHFPVIKVSRAENIGKVKHSHVRILYWKMEQTAGNYCFSRIDGQGVNWEKLGKKKEYCTSLHWWYKWSYKWSNHLVLGNNSSLQLLLRYMLLFI